MTSDSLAEFYGITRHPQGDYMFVMRYYEDGNLYNFLDKNHGIVTWKEMTSMLLGIAEGLKRIHLGGTFHSNLHGANVLVEDDVASTDARITDTGLHGFPNEPYSPNKVYGVLPFIAPEVLKGEIPSKSVDVYSFGIIMALMATGQKPFVDYAHDAELARLICYRDLRPQITRELKSEMPRFYYDLMVSCWDPCPERRPSAIELCDTLERWMNCLYNMSDDPDYSYSPEILEIIDQFKNAEETRWGLIENVKSTQKCYNNGVNRTLKKSPQEIRVEEIYTSRIIDISELRNYFNQHNEY